MPKAPTKAEKEHMAAVKMLPCCVCGATPPSDVHHCIGLAFKGLSQRGSHYDTIPLCKAHHQWGSEAIHQMGNKAWEQKYGYQKEHLEKTLHLLKTGV